MTLSENAVLSIQIADYFYLGPVSSWRRYATALVTGKVSSYRSSPSYGCQSLTAFFKRFRGDWDTTRKGPLPAPEDYGLLPRQPANISQHSIIGELLRRPDEAQYDEPLANEESLISVICAMPVQAA